MSLRQELKKAQSSKLSSDEKIKRLNNLILDLTNEMEAVDENMHPDVNHDLARKLQKTQEILRKVKASVEDMSTETMCKKISHDNTTSDDLGNSPEVERIKDICRVQKNKI